MLNAALFSSKKLDWGTPKDLFDTLDQEFNFDLDPCASEENHKCKKYFTQADDGLAMDWGRARVFCNPPYGRAIGAWVKKCAEHEGLAVLLIPARTDTAYFHEYIYKNPRAEVRFLRGRLRFEGAKHPAPFPSMIVIFRGQKMDYIYSIFVAINGDGYNAGDYESGPEAEAAAEEEAEQLRAAFKAGYWRAAGAEVIITRAPAGRDWLEPKDWKVIKRIKIEL